MNNEVIEKYSDTEIKITVTPDPTPVETIVPLADLKSQVAALVDSKNKFVVAKEAALAQADVQQAEVDKIDAQIAVIQAKIDKASELGVTDTPVVPEVSPEN